MLANTLENLKTDDKQKKKEKHESIFRKAVNSLSRIYTL